MPTDRRIAPSVTEWAGNAIPIQVACDGARRFSRCELPENATDDDGLSLIDLAFAPNRLALAVGALHHLVAIAEPAARLALLYPPTQTTMGLGGEVLQEQGIHRAFEADMQLGDFALCQSRYLYAGKAQMFEQCCHVGLIARNAIQRLGEYDGRTCRAGRPATAIGHPAGE